MDVHEKETNTSKCPITKGKDSYVIVHKTVSSITGVFRIKPNGVCRMLRYNIIYCTAAGGFARKTKVNAKRSRKP